MGLISRVRDWRSKNPPLRKMDMRETPAEIILNGMKAIIHWIMGILVIIAILVVALAIQSARRDDAIDQLDTSVRNLQITTEEARDAAIQARTSLEEAIEQSQSGSGIDPAAVLEAFEAIHRIEEELCGGPCEE